MTNNADNRGRTVIEQVRDLMPRRALGLNECYVKAEQQAYKLLNLLGIDGPHVTYDELLNLPNIEVKPEPKYRMTHFAGVSRFSKGCWLILVDKNDVHGRRRFTLGHEFKHVIDHSLDKIIYARLGYGDTERQHRHIEAICQYFAACFLMPRMWVKSAWVNGIQDVYDLASLFQVSVSAMDVRLKSLGIIDDEPQRPVHTYFRRTSSLLVDPEAMPIQLARKGASAMQRDTQAVLFLRARDLGPDGHDRAAEDRQIALQRDACNAYAAECGLSVIREYAEHGGTGSIDGRPVLRLMLDELTALHDAGYVITYGLDRLARKHGDLEQIELSLAAAEASLLTVRNPEATLRRYERTATYSIGAPIL